MRTYVRMTPRPYRPAAELEAALERGELELAIGLAREVAEDRQKPVELAVALRFLPLVAAQRPETYDLWASRWMVRWLSEARNATIDGAVDVAAALAALPLEPEALQTIARLSG
jgi:hypothetical protein